MMTNSGIGRGSAPAVRSSGEASPDFDLGGPATSSLERLRADLGELADVGLAALPAMFDERSGLFSHKTVVVDGGYVNARPNVLYSTMSLVGLLEQRRLPVDDLLPLGRALDGAHTAVAASGRVGELAHLVWASVLAEDRRGEQALASLIGQLDPTLRASAELGQALHGLVAGGRAYESQRDVALAAARACADELLARFSSRAEVFQAFPRRLMPRRTLIESQFTSFASQVYPLHGLSALYRWTGDQPPGELERVAHRIVDSQGSLGQWWWLYSTRTRAVIEGYPVYSVHQDGMAFLGLVELERLGVGSYADALALGLDWLTGANELGVDLVDREPALINRCIQRTGSDADGTYGLSRSNFARAIGRSFAPRVGGDRIEKGRRGFEVLRECRSYHLGWLLCAHALIERAAAAADAPT